MEHTPDISIIYRALNEEKWFAKSLCATQSQDLGELTSEIILVDSGSTDRTLDIAADYGCRITHINKADFSFGRSLNQGCEFARGKYLVFISAHCIPEHDQWLQALLQPLLDGVASYTYGRQIGHDVSQFSEKQLFQKYFPRDSKIPQEGFFINNANSAILRETWAAFKFDEAVTGLEDMVLGKQLVETEHKIAYVAEAPVIHIHEETFAQTQRRYYREALTLRDILPDIHMDYVDFIRYFTAGVLHDVGVAKQQGSLNEIGRIIRFRYAQYWGSYKGHNSVKKLSRAQKERYYYPAPDKKTEQENLSPPYIASRISAE